MKKILAAVFAVCMLGAFSFAEGYISANDLQPTESLTEDLEADDGFALHATAEKEMRIKKASKKAGDEVFTQRIELRGTGKTGYRSISFPAKKGETITVWGNSGSKTDSRAIVISDGKKAIKEISVKPYTGDVSVDSVKAPADGTYYVFAKKDGSYVYQIKVTK